MSSSPSSDTSFHGRVVPPDGGGGRHRVDAVVVAWVLGLGLVVGLATLGSGGATGQSPRAVAATPRVAADAPMPAPTATADLMRSIRLDRPARRDEIITTRDIMVRGHVASDVAEVWVMLESRGGKLIDSHVVDPTGVSIDGMLPFESRFQPTMQRPAGSMVVFVVAVDGGGTPIDAIRRRIELGALLEVAAPDEPEPLG